MTQRRITVANRDGRSVVTEDRDGLTNAFHAVPGFDPVALWGTDVSPSTEPDNQIAPERTLLPKAGGTTLFVVTFPPDAVMTADGFDPNAAGAEYGTRLPGLAERFEMENPGMHRTATVDYDIVIEGEIWLELDDGAIVHMRQGDIAVQHATRHAWRNRGAKPAKLAFVMIGIEQQSL